MLKPKYEMLQKYPFKQYAAQDNKHYRFKKEV